MNDNVSPVSTPNNQMAVVSIVSAAIAWIVGGLGSCAAIFLGPVAICTGIIFLIGSIVAVVTGHMGRSQIKNSGGLQGGDSLAMFGLILGWIGLIINFLMLCLIIASISGLALLGPEVGDVFSEIINELELTPQP